MKRGCQTTKTPEQVREEFSRAGMSFAEWARARDFTPNLVYMVLRGDLRPRRGQAHRIAVALGLKEGADPGQQVPKRRAA